MRQDLIEQIARLEELQREIIAIRAEADSIRLENQYGLPKQEEPDEADPNTRYEEEFKRRLGIKHGSILTDEQESSIKHLREKKQ